MQKRKKSAYEKTSLPYILPIAALLLMQPFIVCFHLFETGLEHVRWTNSGGYSTDLYLYWKSIFFLTVTAWMAVLLILDRSYVKYTSGCCFAVIWYLCCCQHLLLIILPTSGEEALGSLNPPSC